MDLWHFYLLRSVGKGAFGKVRSFHSRPRALTPAQVRVVQHKQTKALYALKYINKARMFVPSAAPPRSRSRAPDRSSARSAISCRRDDCSRRSSPPSYATCDSHSKMTRICSWSWISCLGGTSAFISIG